MAFRLFGFCGFCGFYVGLSGFRPFRSLCIHSSSLEGGFLALGLCSPAGGFLALRGFSGFPFVSFAFFPSWFLALACCILSITSSSLVHPAATPLLKCAPSRIGTFFRSSCGAAPAAHPQSPRYFLFFCPQPRHPPQPPPPLNPPLRPTAGVPHAKIRW